MASAEFSLAQQRLAARRQNSGRTETLERQPMRLFTRLPGPFGSLGEAWVATWNNINGREGTRPAFRVGQIDAELLDEELLELLKGQIGEALRYFGTNIQNNWSAEIMLSLRAVLFKLTVWDHDATYGAALQNLKFSDARKKGLVLVSPSKWQKALYGAFTVGGPYAWKRWEDWLIKCNDRYNEPNLTVRLLTKLSSSLSMVHSISALFSFLVFLVDGRYRTILDRVLGLRLAPSRTQVNREVSFEYLNRQLVWHAFTEFLLFILPLIGIRHWRRWLARLCRKGNSMIRNGKGEEDSPKTGEFAFLPERTCAICYQVQNAIAADETEILAAAAGSGGVIGSAQTDITNPYEAVPCGCIYCFICLAGRIEAEDGEGWGCLRCGIIIKECRPWNGDVLEDVSKSASSSKTIGFSDKPIHEGKDIGFGETERQVSVASHGPERQKDSDISDDQSEGYEEGEGNEDPD